MIYRILFFISCFIGFINTLLPITTDDCNTISGCFRYPDSCINETCSILYKWSDDGESTHFVLSARLADVAPIESAWIGIGLSKDQKMGDDNACICKNSPDGSSVDHYFLQYHVTPNYLSQADPKLGISDARIELKNGFMTCIFKRAKKLDNLVEYFDLNNQYYVLAAVGPIEQNQLQQHTVRMSSSEQVNFTSSVFKGSIKYETRSKPKAHGCLMVIAWVFLAPVAIIIARYYKSLLPEVFICGAPMWFSAHLPMMTSAVVLSLISLLVIISDLSWTWVQSNEQLEFAHSIFGIITIILAFCQAVSAAFRCHKEHEYRFIFNYIHQSIGLTTYGFAIIAMFLGLSIEKMNLGSVGYGLMIGWVLWLIIVVALIELYAYYEAQQKQVAISDRAMNPNKNFYSFNVQEVKTNENIDNNAETIKLVLLILHVVAALAFMISLLVMIGAR